MIPVHFAGQAADMEAILRIAKVHKLLVVEDAAHAHGATWKGRGLGSIGDAGTFSFQASKNMTAGEGGLIITNREDCAALSESYTSLGRKSQAPWYEHYRLGWNYRMTEFQGAILLQQLKRLEGQNSRRRENAAYLTEQLSRVPGLHTLGAPDYATRSSCHLYMFCLNEVDFGVSRADFLAALEKEGIPCSGGYAHPVYQNPMFRNRHFYSHDCPLSCGHYGKSLDYSSFEGLCPNAERACREAVWFEHRLLLGEREDMDDIVRAIEKIRECRLELQSSAVKSGWIAHA
jgi:dTDP-4-amino-4,6-dideoxygalactose transaminase